MPLNSICRTIAFSALCVSVAWARGGENPRQLSGESAVLRMQDAARLIASGSLGAAEASYSTILQGHPDNTEARLARGHVRAWQHKYEEALDDFLAVLRLDPNNLSALGVRPGARGKIPVGTTAPFIRQSSRPSGHTKF